MRGSMGTAQAVGDAEGAKECTGGCLVRVGGASIADTRGVHDRARHSLGAGGRVVSLFFGGMLP
jgi:hypothetical protein